MRAEASPSAAIASFDLAACSRRICSLAGINPTELFPSELNIIKSDLNTLNLAEWANL